MTDNLWDISLPTKHENTMNWTTTSLKTMNYITTKDKTKMELAQYLHATAFSPSFSTLKKAIDNGNFVTWPGINELNFKKLLGTTIPLEKVHMDQERKNLRSTKDVDAENDDFSQLQQIKKHTSSIQE